MAAQGRRRCCATPRGQDVSHEDTCSHAMAEALRQMELRRRKWESEAVYLATHPGQPNLYDGRARGRVLHIAADPTKTSGIRLTLCAMRIVERPRWPSRAVCMNCVRIAEKDDLKRKEPPAQPEGPTAKGESS